MKEQDLTSSVGKAHRAKHLVIHKRKNPKESGPTNNEKFKMNRTKENELTRAIDIAKRNELDKDAVDTTKTD